MSPSDDQVAVPPPTLRYRTATGKSLVETAWTAAERGTMLEPNFVETAVAAVEAEARAAAIADLAPSLAAERSLADAARWNAVAAAMGEWEPEQHHKRPCRLCGEARIMRDQRDHYLAGCPCLLTPTCVPHGWAGVYERGDLRTVCADHDHAEAR